MAQSELSKPSWSNSKSLRWTNGAVRQWRPAGLASHRGPLVHLLPVPPRSSRQAPGPVLARCWRRGGGVLGQVLAVAGWHRRPLAPGGPPGSSCACRRRCHCMRGSSKDGLKDCLALRAAGALATLGSGLYSIRLESGRSNCLFVGFLSAKPCGSPDVVDAWKVGSLQL